MTRFSYKNIHPTWMPLIAESLSQVDQSYLNHLYQKENWLPGPDKIFNAFSLPLDKTCYILFGESPYPRQQSANGFAFWDNAVTDLWSEKGLSTQVNRATSLRHLIKMLLIADHALSVKNTSQEAIASLNKVFYVKTIKELFENFLNHGFLLLNASLVLDNKVKQDALAWRPFMEKLLELLAEQKRSVKLILLGHIAKEIHKIPAASCFEHLHAEHPYNVSFLHNKEIFEFFEPLKLIRKDLM